MKVLVVCAHPDDETLGCGGTLLKHRDQGDELHWAICTKSIGAAWTEEQRATKAAEVKTVAARYAMAGVHWADWPTASLDTLGLSLIIEFLADILTKVRPEVVYTVHGSDAHSDHRVVFQAAMSVLKPFHMYGLGVRRVLGYEVLSSTEAGYEPIHFVPNVWIDISPWLREKIDVFKIYESEVQQMNFPREESAIRALARYRGATISASYAEGFVLLRETL